MWFNNFGPKKWSRARYVVDSDKKLVKDQIWLMQIYKGCKITFLKIRVEKIILQNVSDILNDFPFKNYSYPYIRMCYCTDGLVQVVWMAKISNSGG